MKPKYYNNTLRCFTSNIKKKEILFSVIIPTYNRADKLTLCLESLVNQTFQNFEVIVCDDGSTDNTIDVLITFNDRLDYTYLYEENWGGPARPRNNGLKQAHGKWICFLDSDDMWTTNKLEACLPYVEYYDMLYHDMWIYSTVNKNKLPLKGRSIEKHNPFEDMLLRGNPCINSSVVLRRSIIDIVGNISEDKALVAVEDFDYWLRVSKNTTRIKHIPKYLGYYYVGDSNISFNERQVARLDALYIRHLIDIKSKKQQEEIIKRNAYRQARIYQMLGLNEEANSKFYIALRSNQIYTILRSLLFIILIKIRKNDKK